MGNVGVEPKSTGTTIGGIAAMAASAASRKKDGGDSQKTGDPDQTPASQIQQGSYKRAIYDDKEEPVNLQADKSNVQEFDSKSDFSMKAAAYRKWKDQEEEGQPVAKVISKILDERPNSDTLRSEKASPDDKKSDFLSSVKAYRKKKSNRNLQVDEGGAEVEPVTTLLDKKYIQGTPGTVSVEDKPFRNQIGLSDAHHTLELEKTGIRGAVTMNLSEDLIKAETGIVVGGNAKSVEKARLNITDRENEAVVELPSVKSNENESGPLTEKNAQKPETANVGAAFPMNEAMEPIQAEADAKTEWTTSTTEAPTTDLDKELEQSTESPGISSSLELPSREQVDATSVPETRKAREEKKGFAGENPVLTSAPVRLESKQTLKVTLDTPRRDVGESGLLIAQTETPAEKGKIFSLSSFLEQPSPENLRSEVLRQNYDESSVAIIAENLQNRPIESHMSETWTQGDTIPNWMGWANQVIRTSDTESVQGFEMSRDLSGLNDFDDDSTIATNYTNYDDTSVVSAMTPARETYVSFDNAYHDHDSSLFSPLGETSFLTVDKADAMAAITPAKVAASILFSDSPSSSIDRTQSNVNSGHDQDLIGTGLSFSADNIGVDAGLSFGADVGFDDGLGFGNDFGNEEWIGAASESQTARDDKNPEKRAKWFPWGNNK